MTAEVAKAVVAQKEKKIMARIRPTVNVRH
jgi:hypothetical protein